MAIDRFETVIRAPIDEQAFSAAKDLVKARAEGDIEGAIDAQRISTHIAYQTQIIERAISDIREAYARLELETLPVEALGVVVPEPVVETSEEMSLVEVAPEVALQAVVLEEELEITEGSDIFGFGAAQQVDSEPVSASAFLEDPESEPEPAADGLDLVEDTDLISAPVEEEVAPVQTVVSAEVGRERLDGLSREDRMIRAIFGLGPDGEHFYNKTFAMAVGEAYRDVLPSKSEDNGEFFQVMNEMGDFISRLIDNLRTYLRNPSQLEDAEWERVKGFMEYLYSEGYPIDIPIEVLRDVRFRNEKVSLDFMIARNKDRAAALAAGRDSQPETTTPNIDKASKGAVSHKGPERTERDEPRTGMSGLKPIKGKPYRAIEYAPIAERMPEPVNSEKMSEAERKLQNAVFKLNDEKEPVYATLDEVVEAVFADQLLDLEGEARIAKVKTLVEGNVLPFILERARAYTMVSQTNGEKAKILQRSLYQKVKLALKNAGYPPNLSPAEVSQLMTRQATLKDLLRKKALAEQVSGKAAAVEIEIDIEPESEPAATVEYKRVDRLTDAQRSYLEVVYARNGNGEFLYPKKEDALRALHPEEYRVAVSTGDKKALALMAAHFGRTGSTLRRLIGQALNGGHAPAELRAFFGKVKASPEFEGLDTDLIVHFSQR